MKGILLLFMLLFSSSYTMPVKGDRVTIKNPVEGNLISASERLTVNAEVQSSIISASKFLDVNSSAKNIIAAASEINIGGDVHNILVSASRNLTIHGNVGEAVVAACDSILLNGSAKDVVVAARVVDITGEVENLYAAAEKIYISGTVKGNLYSTTNKVELRGGGRVLGEIFSPEEIPHQDRERSVKKGWHLVRMVSLLQSFLGIFVITLLLRRSAPLMVDRLSENLFKKVLTACLIGIFFMVTIPVLTLLTMPFFGIYSLGIMLAYAFVFILSKSFLVVALSRRYNYFLSFTAIVGLSFFTIFSFIFSIVGFGLFLLYIKEAVSKTSQVQL